MISDKEQISHVVACDVISSITPKEREIMPIYNYIAMEMLR